MSEESTEMRLARRVGELEGALAMLVLSASHLVVAPRSALIRDKVEQDIDVARAVLGQKVTA